MQVQFEEGAVKRRTAPSHRKSSGRTYLALRTTVSTSRTLLAYGMISYQTAYLKPTIQPLYGRSYDQ